jgi:hypothetical protein
MQAVVTTGRHLPSSEFQAAHAMSQGNPALLVVTSLSAVVVLFALTILGCSEDRA